MRFWASAEIYKDIRKKHRAVSQPLERLMNVHLDEKKLLPEWNVWAVIFMIAPPPFNEVFPEVKRVVTKRREFEFRMKVSYDDYLSGNNKDCSKLLISVIKRSVDLMGDLGVGERDRLALQLLIGDVENELATYL